MSDIAKWAILVAGFLAAIVAICTLPFVSFLPSGIADTVDYLSGAVEIVKPYASNARGLINLFLFPFARNMLSGCLLYLMFKRLMTLSVKISAWAFHFIFK